MGVLLTSNAAMPLRRSCATLLLFAAALQSGAAPAQRDPDLVLWVWERPERLDFLDPRDHGVALLVGTVRLGPGGVDPHRRRQPATWPDGAALTAVVRIEASPDAALGTAQLATTVAAIEAWSRGLEPQAVQIDFDARRSERTFYRTLLTDLRRRLPEATRLEITALASWCLGDPWIADLPIDDAIPMLFRLGVDHEPVRHHLEAGGDFSITRCRNSIGLSLDEPVAHRLIGRRTFLFGPSRWRASMLDRPHSTVGDK